jgi:hypothetical protein
MVLILGRASMHGVIQLRSAFKGRQSSRGRRYAAALGLAGTQNMNVSVFLSSNRFLEG